MNEHSFILNHSPQDGKKFRWTVELNGLWRLSAHLERRKTLLFNVPLGKTIEVTGYAEMRHHEHFLAVMVTVPGR
ncbi:MAG: hypothetical protein IFK92_15310 [Acidobacteria bacterium]|nr:hypothetical protein [Candidatus Sulfomarinibacter kjeldsenii]